MPPKKTDRLFTSSNAIADIILVTNAQLSGSPCLLCFHRASDESGYLACAYQANRVRSFSGLERMLEYELDGTMAGVREMLTDVQANAVYANHFAGVLAIDPAALAVHLPEAPELYSVVLVEVPPQRRVEVSQILQSMMQLPLPQARKLLDKRRIRWISAARRKRRKKPRRRFKMPVR